MEKKMVGEGENKCFGKKYRQARHSPPLHIDDEQSRHVLRLPLVWWKPESEII